LIQVGWLGNDQDLDGLIAELQDASDGREAPIRWIAAKGLGELGERARPAGPALVDAFDDPSKKLRNYAVIAIGKVRYVPAGGQPSFRGAALPG
jgi:HEAT repeat protein